MNEENEYKIIAKELTRACRDYLSKCYKIKQ